MIRFISIAIIFVLSVPICKGEDPAPVTVNITKQTPIETLAPNGDVVAVSEATVGTRLSLVNSDGSQITLQDAQGIRYRIALSSTDYNPPPAVSSTPTNAAAPTPAPVAITPPVIAPVQPANPSPNPPASSPIKQAPLADASVFTIKIGDRPTANEMSVWPQRGIADRPLLIAAHGNGGSGPKEIKGWLQLAKAHNFTIVCPSFLSSVNDVHLPEDDPYFKDCISWIKDNLQFNSDNVFMTGFSGGGFPTWCLATKYPDFFHGLIFQSGNFSGGYYPIDLSHWFNKPIKLIWGSEDLHDITIQNNLAVDMLKSEDCKDYTTEIVPGGHHQEHQDLVVSWMEQNLAEPSSN